MARIGFCGPSGVSQWNGERRTRFGVGDVDGREREHAAEGVVLGDLVTVVATGDVGGEGVGGHRGPEAVEVLGHVVVEDRGDVVGGIVG